MKKFALACILISGAYSLQAQTQQLKPKDFSNPTEQYFKPNFGIKPYTYNLLNPKLNLDQALVLNNNTVINQPFLSKMPIIKLDGFDNMPVAKLDGYNNMPILGYNADKAKKSNQLQVY